ncbi:MAG: DNA-processing protein DprA [Oscillospiraceae bacterium]|nr:DNA-processing protein DprA [Oscillospiraceae bacterium]
MNIRTDYYPALYRLWSVIALGAGTAALYEAMDLFEDPTELFCGLSEPEGLPPEMRSKLSPQLLAAKKVSLDKAEAVFEECSKKGISIVPIDSELYPKRLLKLYRPPAVLFVKGNISGIDDRLSISVVGARKASEYSLKITSGIVRTLAGNGFDIVSGFAEGVDICAHLTAVKSGTRTFAVLGTGLDVDYPKPNVRYRKYIEENGAFISEYLPKTVGRPANFPQRNRILVALSLGTAVIEAGAKSGSLNSASHGADQGKPVFAVPPCDLFDSRYYGNAELIRQGAVPLMGARDIYNEYCLGVSHTIDENEPLQQEMERLERECGVFISGRPGGSAPEGKKIRSSVAKARRLANKMKEEQKAEKQPRDSVSETSENMPSEGKDAKKPAGKSAKRNAEKTAEDREKFTVPEGLTEEQNRVVNALAEGDRPMRADEIAEVTGRDIDDVLEVITDLELLGVIGSEGSNYKLRKE